MAFNTGAFAFNKSPFGTPQQAPAPSPFGTPAPANPFGQPTTPTFGASAPAGATTTAFGATSTSAFGAPAATPAFGQASSAGFGFGAASTPAFGAASTPANSLFKPATPAFGQASTPAFGTSFSTPFPPPAFGASSASPFGQQSAPATTGTSLFGSTASPLFPSASQGAFGSTFTGASPFGGSALQPAAGALVPAGQQPFGTATQMAPATFSGDAAVKEISEIRNAYSPQHPNYKFQALFLNVVDNPQQKVRPANVDEMRWRQAIAQAGGPENLDRLWPVAGSGFKDLLSRSGSQAKALEENQARLKALTDMAHRMAKHHATELKQRMAEVQRRHIELAHRLLKASRCVDALESRLAVSMGYRGDLSHSRETDLSRQLSMLEAEVAPTAAAGLQRRLEAVAAAARLRLGAPAGADSTQAKFDEASMKKLFEVLREHVEAVQKLQGVLKQDLLDVEIMRQAMGGGSADMALGM